MSAAKVLRHLALSLLACGLVFTAIAQSQDVDSNDQVHAQPASGDFTPVSEDRLDRALVNFEADDGFQKARPEWDPDLPDPEDIRTSEPNAFVRAIAAFFEAIGSVLGYLLAAIILIAILAGIYMVFGESLTLRGRQKDKAVDPDISLVPDLRPEARRARALLEDADALAAQGQFAEAVHLLLFRSIEDIQEKKSGVIGRSLTAREIGALGILPDWIRDTLSPIIRIVERSFFGGQDVTEAGWREARQSYETFAFGEAWS
ncbi:MAG: hypothetical protein AAGL97_01730 [Pseudomonadota bacterium]